MITKIIIKKKFPTSYYTRADVTFMLDNNVPIKGHISSGLRGKVYLEIPGLNTFSFLRDKELDLYNICSRNNIHIEIIGSNIYFNSFEDAEKFLMSIRIKKLRRKHPKLNFKL